jgi:hypothetical protein
MAKAKTTAPTSIRLTPESDRYVQLLVSNTGWSVSKVIEFLLTIGSRAQCSDTAGVSACRVHLLAAMEAKKQFAKAEAIASHARAKVRKTAAAVKGQK